MKKILITGKNSYIGTSFKKYIKKWPKKYQVTELSLHGKEWKQHDFSKYNIIFHVAGIAHVSTNPNKADLYYKVNRDLTIELAEKAKKENIQQFIFMSSIIVYGKPENGVITKDTKVNPENYYGRSKLEAEKGLQEMETNNFQITIIRAPMVYGPNSKGNYPKLARLAKFTPIFPDYPNKRSMLFINNLSHFLKIKIDNNENGIFHPQNNEYIQTSKLVKEIGKVNNNKVYLTKLFNYFIKLLLKIKLINKIFGDLYYLENENKNKIEFKESIEITEMKNVQ